LSDGALGTWGSTSGKRGEASVRRVWHAIGLPGAMSLLLIVATGTVFASEATVAAQSRVVFLSRVRFALTVMFHCMLPAR
jgi:hypothetical protein